AAQTAAREVSFGRFGWRRRLDRRRFSSGCHWLDRRTSSDQERTAAGGTRSGSGGGAAVLPTSHIRIRAAASHVGVVAVGGSSRKCSPLACCLLVPPGGARD